MSDASSPNWTLVATILGSSLTFIDGTVVNVALPALQADLHATIADVQWVIEAYSLCLGGLCWWADRLGDQFGRRRTFLVGIALFTLASIACGLATRCALGRRSGRSGRRRGISGAGQSCHHHSDVQRRQSRAGDRHLVRL